MIDKRCKCDTRLFRSGLLDEIDADKDFAIARQKYRRAAIKGDRRAQYFLALSYAMGEGGWKSNRLAMAWFKSAVCQGEELCEMSVQHLGGTAEEQIKSFERMLDFS